ncbi:uncharacterized protein LOC114519969 [Dendronephthya gigantea]|uniref:uncharacterized protein LOC114519969 n=1 Tax=Dendronephthya gigantea TaxID=151771 RepID=UPI00106DBE60|nr:uncharacterized protein LOC114519969 [Dendronephthya gigantea]
MASSSRVFRQSFRFARNLKVNSCKVQSLVSSAHVPNSGTQISNGKLARPLASVCGLLNGSAKCTLKTKIQFAAPQVSNVSLVARSASFLSPASQESDESSLSTSEGSDSSCEAMEGPHGDDDGLVITSSSSGEDL